MKNRLKALAMLTMSFNKEYKEAMKPYEIEQQIELTDYLLEVTELINEYERSKDDKILKTLEKKEDALAKRFGKSLKPFKIKSFHKYFMFDIVLNEKDIYTADEFNALSSEEQVLSGKEIARFIRDCQNTLRNAKSYLYLEAPPEFEPKSKMDAGETETMGGTPDKEITRSRQLLAIYYALKAGFGIEHRRNANISDIAKFVHLMTGTKFNGLNNSEIYKKYKDIPGHKEGAELVKDLKFIRHYFETLEIKEAVKLIDEDIARAMQDIPYAQRKKYRSEG